MCLILAQFQESKLLTYSQFLFKKDNPYLVCVSNCHYNFKISERDRFLPTAAGVHLSGINAATLAAQQGGLAGSASDYMRLAMPVRDPDNGDAISGSG